ncbi:MAG: hypothetical protein IJ690_05080 [Clostridia bacterium]|nr:hypothetical protein [Clostridia bacterium]
MENQNKKNNAGTIALVVLLLIVTIAALILATYAWAKYSATPEVNTATANVAHWNVSLGSNNSSFVQTYNHVVNTKIAPGTKGSFEVEISGLADTEVCVAYQVTLDSVTFTPGSSISHLKFFKEASYENEIVPNGTSGSNIAFAGTIDLDDHEGTPANNAANDVNTVGAKGTVTDGKLTKTIYWVWPYDYDEANNITAYQGNIEATPEAYDATDTAVGEGGVTSMSLAFTVKAWQVDPGASDGANNTATTNK